MEVVRALRVLGIGMEVGGIPVGWVLLWGVGECQLVYRLRWTCVTVENASLFGMDSTACACGEDRRVSWQLDAALALTYEFGLSVGKLHTPCFQRLMRRCEERGEGETLEREP